MTRFKERIIASESTKRKTVVSQEKKEGRQGVQETKKEERANERQTFPARIIEKLDKNRKSPRKKVSGMRGRTRAVREGVRR